MMTLVADALARVVSYVWNNIYICPEPEIVGAAGAAIYARIRCR